MYGYTVNFFLVVFVAGWAYLVGHYFFNLAKAFITEEDFEFPYDWMSEQRAYSEPTLKGPVFGLFIVGWFGAAIAAIVWPAVLLVGGAAYALYYLREEHRKANS